MSQTASPIALRAITDTDRDIDGALLLSQAVRWPYRRADWQLALALGRGLVMEDEGQIVASALWWPYGETLATCGIIIVSPAMQGRGLGRALMERLLEETGERPILLNSTLEGHRLYREFGFEDISTVHQHQGQASAAAPSESDRLVRAARPDETAAIVQMDECAFGAPRPKLIEEFDRIGTVAVIERDGILQGFAMCRPFGLGHAVGPVIARTAEDARSLIQYFLSQRAGEFLRVDIPGDSGLAEWLATHGLPEVGNVTTMIRGVCPAISGPERIYGLASQSFG